MKINNYHSSFLLLLIFLSVVGANNSFAETEHNIISLKEKLIILKHWKIARDSSPKSLFQNSNDIVWKTFNSSLQKTEYSEGNWLLKTEIVIDDSLITKNILGLFPINFVTAYEIYWDGKKIAQNGIIGINNTDEKAGLYNYNTSLPTNLVTSGKHIVILRISNYHSPSSWKWYYGGIYVGPYEDVLKNLFISKYQSFLVMGILFIPFLFNLFLYVARKRKTEHLLFSLLCFIVILDAATNLVPTFIDVQTIFINWELYSYQIITVLFTILFPAFFIYTFSFHKKFIGVIIVTVLIIYLLFTNLENVFTIMPLTVLILSSIIIIWALFKRREGSVIISIGLIVAWAAYYFSFAFNGLAATMVICTSISIARQFAIKEKAEREAQLKSSHLENELLKKNINPHFLLNSLTSIIVWLRKDPKLAIKLIETLAEEFRMVSQISSLKLIPIQQEIDLCKSHLKIMNYRKGADYKLETVDIIEDENVPPMIFHTLVENGLTHGYENKIRGTFTLQRKKNSDCVQYILSNDGDFTHDEPKDSSGFGFQYIKGRLEESYHNRWEFISQRKELGWETVIKIRNK